MSKLKLTKVQKELLIKMVSRGYNKPFSLQDESEQKRAELIEQIEAIAKKLDKFGVPLYHAEQKYWFEYKDIDRGGLKEYAREERKDSVFLQICPGHNGIGTRLFEPLIAQGLNIFLNNARPYLNGEPMCNESILDRLDAVFFLGGLIPELSKNPSSRATIKKTSILAQLTPEEMAIESTPRGENRLNQEKSRLEQIIGSGVLSAETKKEYEDHIYGTISNISEGARRANTILTKMFANFDGPIFYQKGSEDLANEGIIRDELKKEISSELRKISKCRRIIENSLGQIQSNEVRKILAANTHYVLQDMEDWIFSKENMKRVKRECGLTEEDLRENPREPYRRRIFELLRDNYIKGIEGKLKSNEFDWRPEYFAGMDAEEVERFKQEYQGNVCNLTMASLRIIRTLYGLGWQQSMRVKRIHEADAKIYLAREHADSNEIKIEEALDLLSFLGWIGEKPVTEAEPPEALLLNARAREKMMDLFGKVAGDLDLKVLSEGVSFIDINGWNVRMEYLKNNSDTHKKLDEVSDRLSELGMNGQFVPDITLVGPGTKMIIRAQPKGLVDYAEGPSLVCSSPIETAWLVQLSNLYTVEAIEKYHGYIAEENRDSKSPSELFPGNVLIWGIGKEGGIYHFDPISVDDLKRLALNEITIDSLLEKMRGSIKENIKCTSSEKPLNLEDVTIENILDKKLYEKIPGTNITQTKQIIQLAKHIVKLKERFNYNPEAGCSVIGIDDLHLVDSESPVLVPASEIRRVVIGYLKNNFSTPDILKFSELTDGAQYIKGIELSAQHNVPSIHQMETAMEKIKIDNKISTERKVALLEELLRVTNAGMSLPTVDEQMEALLRSSPVGDYCLETIKNGGDVIVVGGDHSGRTTGSKGDEATRFRNGFHLVDIDSPDGNKIRASDKIFIGARGELSGHFFYRGVGDLEGINIYAFHKGQENIIKQIRNIGADVRLALAGHTHHLEIVVVGDNATVTTPGYLAIYNFVLEKGLKPGIHGAVRTCIPKKDSLYRSMSFDVITDEIIERDSGVSARMELRRELMNYLPPR